MFLSSGGNSYFIRDEHKVLKKNGGNILLYTLLVYFWG